jgi:hypothetical protein
MADGGRAFVWPVDGGDVDSDGLAFVTSMAGEEAGEEFEFGLLVGVDAGFGGWVGFAGGESAGFDFDDDEGAIVRIAHEEIALAGAEADVAGEEAVATGFEVACGGAFAAAAEGGFGGVAPPEFGEPDSPAGRVHLLG